MGFQRFHPLLTLPLFTGFFLAAPFTWAQAPHAGGTIEGVVSVTAPPRPEPQAKSQNSYDSYDSYDSYGSSAYDSAPARQSPQLPEEIVVYLVEVKGTWPPPKEHARLDQKFTQFTHRVLPVLVGTTVDFTNHDPIYHNVFSDSIVNQFDLGRRGNGETASMTFKKPEVPVKIFCEIHAKMQSNILVLQNPYFRVVKPGETFKLEKVPAGTYTLAAWHDYWQPVSKEITVRAGEKTKADLTLSNVQR